MICPSLNADDLYPPPSCFYPFNSVPLSLNAYSELGPDHEWQTAVDHRTRVGSGCPMCSGVALSVTNSLAAVDELVASQWHPTNHRKRAGPISWTVLGQDRITVRLRSPYSADPVSQKRRLWSIGENIPSPGNAHSLPLKSLDLPKKLVYGGWKPFIR